MATSKAAAARKIQAPATDDASNDNTRDRILDVAERLFAERGIENVTLRDVTSVAGVNLAAVHYHIGSRDELLRAILVRRMTPLLAESKRRLAGLPKKGSKRDRVEYIVRSFVEPSMDYDCSDDNYLVHRLTTRLAIYEELHPIDLFQYTLADTHAKFIDALAEALPHLDRERVGYRFEFMLALMTHATTLRARLTNGKHEIHGIRTDEGLVPELISTVVSAFCAP